MIIKWLRVTARESELETIAAAYDNKITQFEDLNTRLADQDKLYFNHNGTTLRMDSFNPELLQLSDEEKLQKLHEMEKNTVLHGSLYLPKKIQETGEERIILDACCGAGGSSIMLHAITGDYIEGVTISKEQVKYGDEAINQYGFSDHINFSRDDMVNLKKPKNYYDCIWVCESSEHVQRKDLKNMFLTFKDIAKPNATMVMINWIMDTDTCETDLLKPARNMGLKQQIDDHYNTSVHTFGEYIHYANSAGWKIQGATDLTPYTIPYWTLRNSLSEEKKQGSEEFMLEGFKSRDLLYFIMVFALDK